MNSCKKCNEAVHGNYCPNCGYPATLKKIDGRYIMDEIRSTLFVNNGLLYTIKSLITKPGETVRHFIKEDRSQYVKPVTFLVITSLLYAIVKYFFPIELEENTFYVNPFFDIQVEGIPTATVILNWMAENYAYSGILTGLFMTFGLKISFRKTDYNIFEIFILLCFVSGISTLFLSVGTIFQSITHLNVMKFTSPIVIIYFVWSAGQFFGKKKAASYIKSFLSYILGTIMFAALIVLFGLLFDIIINY